MNGLQYTHQTGACGTNDCTIGNVPQKCPEGHSGPFHHTLIGLPGRDERAEWWFHCHHKDPKEDGWCDQRFPGPAVTELITLLVSPEIYPECCLLLAQLKFQDELPIRKNHHGSNYGN